MGESLNQPSRVREDGPTDCKPLLSGNKERHACRGECTRRKSIGYLRASSRGNTEDASVIRIYWVYRVRRRRVKPVVKLRGSTP